MLTFFDTHAHMDYPDFAPDLPDVIARAQAAGISKIISIGTSLDSSRRAIQLAERFPNIFAVVGWHPTESAPAPADLRPALRELARHPKVVAIGETGLDYHRLPGAHRAATVRERPTDADNNRAPTAWDRPADANNNRAATVRERPAHADNNRAATVTERSGSKEEEVTACKQRQADLFQQQLEVAAEYGLNCVIHQRDAFDDTLAQLRAFAGKIRGVFHCFGEDLGRMKQVLEIGSLVSFTGIVTFKNGQNVRDTVAATPLDKFMLETDCPYLAPVPYRGKRCEPAYVKEISETIAQAKKCSLEELSAATCRTAHEFFPKMTGV